MQLDASIKAVGMAHFALAQGLQRDSSALTTAFLAKEGKEGGQAVSSAADAAR